MATQTVTLNAKERKAVIDGLIGAECCFEENEREVLNTLSDRTLARLTLNAKKMPKFIQDEIDAKKAKEDDEDAKDGDDESTENDKLHDASADGDVAPMGELDPKPPKKDGVANQVRNQLSPEDRQFLAIGRKMVADARNGMIRTITTNAKDVYTEKELQAMTHNQLEKLAKAVAITSSQEEEAPLFNMSRASYFGAAVPLENTRANEVDEEGLPLPTMNWQENAKANRAARN